MDRDKEIRDSIDQSVKDANEFAEHLKKHNHDVGHIKEFKKAFNEVLVKIKKNINKSEGREIFEEVE